MLLFFCFPFTDLLSGKLRLVNQNQPVTRIQGKPKNAQQDSKDVKGENMNTFIYTPAQSTCNLDKYKSL